MFDIIEDIVGYVYTGTGMSNMNQYYVYASLVIIILFTITVIDLIYRTIRHFWR